MAELALGALGVVLAWKGIVDFCAVVSDLLNDSVDERQVLQLRTKCAAAYFKDWGKTYGLGDRGNGVIMMIDESREALIRVMLQRQLKATSTLLKTLNRYDTSVPNNSTDEPSFRRAIDVCKRKFQKSGAKIRWKSADEKTLRHFVTELDLMVDCLRKISFYENLMPKEKQILDIDTFKAEMANLKDLMLLCNGNLRSIWLESSATSQEKAPLETALASSLEFVQPLELMDRVKQLTHKAFYTEVDARIGEDIATWWCSPISLLCIETSLDFSDETPDLTAAATYSLVEQPKLIYMFDRLSTRPTFQQFADMTRSLIYQVNDFIITSAKKYIIPTTIETFSSQSCSLNSLKLEIDLFLSLISQITITGELVTLVVEGLEILSVDRQAAELCRYLLTSLKDMTQRSNGSITTLKCVFIGRGHSDFLVPDDTYHLLDAVDRGAIKENLFHRLKFVL